MKKIYNILLLSILLSYSNMVSAQVLAIQKEPTQKTEEQKINNKVSDNKSQQKEEALFDENGAPNKVIKNFDNKNLDSKKRERKYDRNVFSFKIVDGKAIIEDTERSILVSYGNYKINQGFGNWISCSIRVYILNDLEVRLSNIGLKLIWPDITTTINMRGIDPGVRAYKDITLLGEGCLTMDKTPTIEVNFCRVKDMSPDKCADAIRWFNGRS